jgi:hypothetical protein
MGARGPLSRVSRVTLLVFRERETNKADHQQECSRHHQPMWILKFLYECFHFLAPSDLGMIA